MKEIKLYIKSQHENKYLLPIFNENNWIDKVSDECSFTIYEKDLSTVTPSTLVDDVLLNKKDICLTYFENNIEYIIKKDNTPYILNKSSFCQVKKDFNLYHKNHIEHYLIYNIIKRKEVLSGISIGKRSKFHNILSITIKFLKMIDHYPSSKEYLKAPFHSIPEDKFILILKKVKESLI